MPTTLPNPPSLAAQVWASPWLRPLNDPGALDELLGAIWPAWSRTRVRARVVGARSEAPNVRTLILRPNGLWAGHQAGQHVNVEVEVDGRRLRRTFSLSSAPRQDGLLEITVKRGDNARVSAWWNDTAALGDVVTLGQASGEFVLPNPLPSCVVLVGAGSGVTPLMAMLRGIAARPSTSPSCRVIFALTARTRDDVIFGRELADLAASNPWLDLRIHVTGEHGRWGQEVWSALAAETEGFPSFVCGPPTFLQEAQRAWTGAGQADQLRMERFTASRRNPDPGAVAHTAEATHSGRTIVVAPGQTLLEAAETAGLRPNFGCRIGVCHTCRCRKVSGVVEDVRDGRITDEPDAMIQLCVSTPRSAVTIEL